MCAQLAMPGELRFLDGLEGHEVEWERKAVNWRHRYQFDIQWVGPFSNMFLFFTPIFFLEDSHFDDHIFSDGWFNHQLDIFL